MRKLINNLTAYSTCVVSFLHFPGKQLDVEGVTLLLRVLGQHASAQRCHDIRSGKIGETTNVGGGDAFVF